ncbi:CBS domain-containing protein [Actinoplanes sp. N902-109]|uniref:CBS domain-containing protein n=1 Tax=Actinoplanes sp. (strain N902-109) TaxID=649831 RepID=UPI0003295632|nr:CBS domain-containing protein [Actinoplanes sp. N902-109]AGL19124.1 CBS domain-containing protein [Actinoplanes sp. N902-109]
MRKRATLSNCRCATFSSVGGIGLTLGNLLAEDHELGSVAASATFEEAVTAMQMDDYSQLAVLEDGQLLGAVTWQSIATAKHYNPEATFQAAIDRSVKVFDYDNRLLDVIGFIRDDGFIFVRDEDRLPSGILTYADVVDKYDETATPFFLIGEIDQELRQVVQSLADDGLLEKAALKTKKPEKMSIYDYEQALKETCKDFATS